jgi:hypothetical protein
MSRVVSMRLKDEQYERLKRYARRTGHTPSETAARVVEEALREAEFAYIEFRDTPIGRQAYIRGRRSPVWMVIWIAREYGMDACKTAEHFDWPVEFVKSAFNYYDAFPEEVEYAIADQESYDFEKTKRMFPNAIMFPPPSEGPQS